MSKASTAAWAPRRPCRMSSTAWVMGNESWGLPTEHLQLADTTVAVPIYGAAESLKLQAARLAELVGVFRLAGSGA